jgi:hypothetical protein
MLNSERVWFRLSLVAAALSALLAVALRYHYRIELRDVADLALGKSAPDLTSETAVWLGVLASRQQLWLELSWFLPALIIVVYYAIRWAITGRIRPLWPT